MTTAGLARATGWLLVCRLVAQALLLVATVLLARRLGVEGFGGVAFIVAAVYLANVLTTFGTDMVLIREMAAGRPSRWAAAFVLQVTLSIAAIAVLLGVAFVLVSDADAAAALAIYSLALLPMAAFSVATAVLRGRSTDVLRGRRFMGAHGLLAVASAAIQAAAVAALVGPGATLRDVALVLLAVQVASAAIAVAAAGLLAPDLRGRWAVSRSDVVAMARSSATIGALGGLGVAFQRLPLFAVAAWAGPAATGWFAGAQRLVDASKVGHVALLTALYPAMAAGTIDRGFSRTWRASIVAATAIAVVVFLVAGPVIDALYGPGFEPAAGALAILAWAVIPSTSAGYRSLELLAAGRDRSVLGALLVGLATLLVLMVTLFAAIGWTGIAWALLVAEIVQAAGLELAVHRLGVTARTRVAAGTA